MYPMSGRDDEKLNALFEAFRKACPDPEASPNFMPNLWMKIESRQRFSFSLTRMASAFVTAALAASLALGLYLSTPGNSGYYTQSYVEALSSQDNTADFFEPVHMEVQ